MPVYDFECPDEHLYEVRCTYEDRQTKAHPCDACGKIGRSVLINAPRLNDPNKCVLSYPGSQRLKAGYVHSHGDKPATKIQAGYGGVLQENNRRHHHPIANNVIPETKKAP
jgi:hypothetical protein